jgi:hypothetical protein
MNVLTTVRTARSVLLQFQVQIRACQSICLVPGPEAICEREREREGCSCPSKQASKQVAYCGMVTASLLSPRITAEAP